MTPTFIVAFRFCPQYASVYRKPESNKVERLKVHSYPEGRAFTRAAIALCRSRGDVSIAEDWARKVYADTPSTILYLSKAAVAAGDPSDSTWAGPLAQTDFASFEFAQILFKGSILGKLNGLRRVPFQTSYPLQTGASSVAWVGFGQPTPVSKLQFQLNSLGYAKIGGLVVITKELSDLSGGVAEGLIQDDLVKSATGFMDEQFISPSVAAVVNASPASITNGITPTQSTGSTATQIAADLATVATAMADANETDALHWIMTRGDAVRLAAKRDTAGAPAFPTVTASGGTLLGIPVITSNAVPHSTSGGTIVVLVNAISIDFALSPNIQLDASDEASLQMSDSPGTGAQQSVSLWQNNWRAIRMIQWANWARVRSTAVTYIDNCHW